jgi:hypothetical protein
MDIEFKRTTEFLGRNGVFNCTGLYISWGPEKTVNIYPITSKKVLGRCRIAIPQEAIPDVIKALKFQTAGDSDNGKRTQMDNSGDSGVDDSE